MSVERDQVISFLLQQCDQKNTAIQQLQMQLTETQKKLAVLEAGTGTQAKPNGAAQPEVPSPKQ